jgi:hypothetical protein
MSAIPVEQIKRKRHETSGGLKHILVSWTNEICAGTEVRCFTGGGST